MTDPEQERAAREWLRPYWGMKQTDAESLANLLRDHSAQAVNAARQSWRSRMGLRVEPDFLGEIDDLKAQVAQAEERGYRRAVRESVNAAERCAALIATLNERETRAFREGQEEMRVQAGLAAVDRRGCNALEIAEAIRALPLTERKPL